MLLRGLVTLGVASACFIEPRADHPVMSTAQPSAYDPSLSVPPSFDWRSQVPSNTSSSTATPMNLITPPRTQFLPRPCGSCWACAATGALSDKIKIATRGRYPDLAVSPQVLLNSGSNPSDNAPGSCGGGSDLLAYSYIQHHGITDETCMPYAGVDNNAWGESPVEARMCRTCDRFGSCTFKNASLIVNVSAFGTVTGGLLGTQQEIMNGGPVTCSVYAHSKSFEEYTGGVIADPAQYPGTTHVITLIGWGVEDSKNASEPALPYWIGRNSFGTGWGENFGFFRIKRGANTLNLEERPCRWASVSDETIKAVEAANRVG